MGRTACAEPQCLYKGALYLTFTGVRSNYMEYFCDFYYQYFLNVCTDGKA